MALPYQPIKLITLSTSQLLNLSTPFTQQKTGLVKTGPSRLLKHEKI
jgi:hypothetical protein